MKYEKLGDEGCKLVLKLLFGYEEPKEDIDDFYMENEKELEKLYASYSAIAIAVKNRNDSLTLKNGVRSGGVYLKGDYWTRNDYIADVIGRAVAPDELFYGDAVIDWSYVCDHTGSEILMSVLTDDGKEEFIRKVPDSWYIDSKFPNFYTNRLSREVRLNNPKIFK